MTGRLGCCPACGSAAVGINTASRSAAAKRERARYRCKHCLETFDEPEERPADGHRNSRNSAHAKALIDAEPDEIGGGNR
jgi:transposase-like protein